MPDIAPSTAPLMPHTLQWLPATATPPGRPAQLMLLLHGWGARAADMAPLAQALQQAFPQAALLAPEGFEPVDSGLAGRDGGAGSLAGRQWFSLAGVTEANRPERVAAVLPRLAMQRLAAMQGDATIDIANGVGHALHPELVQCAVQRLQTHIPHRTWAAAMGAVPGLAERQAGAEDD